MRLPVALAIVALSLAGAHSATAADYGIGGTYGYGAYYGGARAGALIVYDNEPGVTIRAYWLPPWRNRHYFPFHAAKPRRVSAGGPAEAGGDVLPLLVEFRSVHRQCPTCRAARL